jgi:hypothetical protein
MIRNLIKIILIISLFALPTSCELIKPIIIEDAANIGAVDMTFTYDESLFVITDISDGDFDVTESNLEHAHNGTVRIVAFQMANPGLNGRVTLCSITLAGDLTDLGSLHMTVNTLKDATPQCSPIDSTVDGFTITTLSLSPSTSTDSRRGGGGTIHTPTPAPAPSPTISSVARTPVEAGTVAEAPTPEQVMEFRAEQPSLPPPVSPPTAGIVIVACCRCGCCDHRDDADVKTTSALQIAVRGEYSVDADVSGDDQVTSLDALMILQTAAGNIQL